MYLLHQYLDRWAAESPSDEALSFEGRSVSAGDLAEHARRIANTLAGHGVGRGDVVAIVHQKGLEAAAAMYGVLKAGAAYVAPDPWLPPERLAAVLSDCGVRTLFADQSRLKTLTAAPLHQTALESTIGLAEALSGVANLSWDDVSRQPDAAVRVAQTERDLAYIYYTSGSTGEPKGMMHTHRSGLTFANWTAEMFGLSSDDRVGNHAPLHFDLSIFDFIAAASVRAPTVILSEQRQKMPSSLAAWIEQERITALYAVPSAWMQMLDRGGVEDRDWSRLRLALFAGEPFPKDQLRRLAAKVPHAELWNLYGVTEANVCTCHRATEASLAGDEPLPLGRIAPNMEGVVLGDDDQPAETGVTGELAVRGPSLMEGYCRRPELDASIYWHRRLGDGPPQRFYRTGDLVRLCDDGEYRFQGRKDRQVKIRGHRTELDEVQAALEADPRIREAAVFDVPDGQGSRGVEAVVTLRNGAAWDEAAVRRGLREKIPPYAAPTAIRLREAMPRTSAGKIDWRALTAAAPDAAKESG